MSTINRKPNESSVHHVHLHNCPNCHRDYSCNCHKQPDTVSMVCIDCEHGTYDPVIHGGKGRKSEA